MNSTIAEQINVPIRESLRTESRATALNFRARWQTAFETESGHALQKLRLESVPSVSELLLNSTHGSNDSDRSINILRPSYLPAST